MKHFSQKDPFPGGEQRVIPSVQEGHGPLLPLSASPPSLPTAQLLQGTLHAYTWPFQLQLSALSPLLGQSTQLFHESILRWALWPSQLIHHGGPPHAITIPSYWLQTGPALAVADEAVRTLSTSLHALSLSLFQTNVSKRDISLVYLKAKPRDKH